MVWVCVQQWRVEQCQHSCQRRDRKEKLATCRNPADGVDVNRVDGKNRGRRSGTSIVPRQPPANLEYQPGRRNMQQDARKMPKPGSKSAAGVQQQHPHGKYWTIKLTGPVAQLTPKIGAEKFRQVRPRLHLRVVHNLRKIITFKPAKQRTRIKEKGHAASGQRQPLRSQPLERSSTWSILPVGLSFLSLWHLASIAGGTNRHSTSQNRAFARKFQ